MKINLDMKLDNKDYYYHVKKNKNGHLVRQKIYKKSKDAIFKSTELSVANNMASEIDLDSIIAKNQIKDKITQVLTSLTPREERVIRMRFGIGLNTDYTLEEVGQVLCKFNFWNLKVTISVLYYRLLQGRAKLQFQKK